MIMPTAVAMANSTSQNWTIHSKSTQIEEGEGKICSTVATKRYCFSSSFFLLLPMLLLLLYYLLHISLQSCCYASMVLVLTKLCKTIQNVDRETDEQVFISILQNGALFFAVSWPYKEHRMITLQPKADERAWAKCDKKCFIDQSLSGFFFLHFRQQM